MLKVSQGPYPKQSKNGVPFNERTFNLAAKKGNLKEMKWLHENGCPWSKLTFDWAATNGSLKNMKWLKKKDVRGVPVPFIMQLQMAA